MSEVLSCAFLRSANKIQEVVGVSNDKNLKKADREISGFFKTVERVGNALPHPAIIFFIMSVILVFVAEILARQGVAVDYFDAKKGEEVSLTAVSLLNR